jgi:hypothetical protein
VREIAKLRKTLGDDPKTPKYIQTVQTRGYRFIATVEVRNPSENLSPANGNDSKLAEQASSNGHPAAIAAPRQRARQRAWAMRLAVAGILVALATSVWLGFRARKASNSPATTLPLTIRPYLPGVPAFQHTVWEPRMPRILELSLPLFIVCSIDEELAGERHLKRAWLIHGVSSITTISAFLSIGLQAI